MPPLGPITPEETPLFSPPPFEEMWKGVLPKLKAVLARHGIPATDGEDLVQKAVEQYLRKRDQVRSPERWLPVALTNICRMYWRTHSRRLTLAVDQPLLEVLADPLAPAQERAVLRAELRKMLAGIKQRCRSILALRYLGYDRHEIAGETGYKVSSIDKLTRRCIDELTRRFQKAAGRLWGGDR